MALCGADRIPGVTDGGSRATSRNLRLWRRCSIVAQVARHRGQQVFAFTRPGDEAAQAMALDLGCAWAGGSDERPPDELDAALLFAPVGALVPKALRDVAKAVPSSAPASI